ncbi:MAG TPA: molybdenum cofactor biosynthesis protein MoaE [Tepidisphaeraceae bacterium]|nr:molybdenum cofactor biosynthesis protein MoaE [Tepidisphaeraceae bacterium]
MKDWIGILGEAIPLAEGLAFVVDPAAGGIDVFVGTVRAERKSSGEMLVGLEYEAYVEMAAEQLQDLARRARARWPIVKLVLLHRQGRVEVGQPSVLIAVSTPHREECFAACRFLIDTLKGEVAIWKKEIWGGGEC